MTRRITILGGTGFIGRHLVALLLQSGTAVRVAARHPGRIKIAAEATNSPEIVQADILDDTSVGRVIAGTDAIINLVGILTETNRQTYHAIHVAAGATSRAGCKKRSVPAKGEDAAGCAARPRFLSP